MKKSILILLIAGLGLVNFACRKKNKNDNPYPNYYDGSGNANIPAGGSYVVNGSVNHNVNTSGEVVLGSGTEIGQDINSQEGSKVIVNTLNPGETAVVRHNINAKDSIIINTGHLKIEDDINLSSRGSIKINPGGSLSVGHNINSNGHNVYINAFEFDTIFIASDFNLNGGTLHIKSGVVKIGSTLNGSNNGVILIEEKGQLLINRDLNHSNTLYGFQNVQVNGAINKGPATYYDVFYTGQAL